MQGLRFKLYVVYAQFTDFTASQMYRPHRVARKVSHWPHCWIINKTSFIRLKPAKITFVHQIIVSASIIIIY